MNALKLLRNKLGFYFTRTFEDVAAKCLLNLIEVSEYGVRYYCLALIISYILNVMLNV